MSHWIYDTIITVVRKQVCQISVHATASDIKGETFTCRQGQGVRLNPATAPGTLKPIIMNVNAETKAGRQTAQSKPADYCKPLSPKNPQTAKLVDFRECCLRI